jgi:hypothetical protein
MIQTAGHFFHLCHCFLFPVLVYPSGQFLYFLLVEDAKEKEKAYALGKIGLR